MLDVNTGGHDDDDDYEEAVRDLTVVARCAAIKERTRATDDQLDGLINLASSYGHCFATDEGMDWIVDLADHIRARAAKIAKRRAA